MTGVVRIGVTSVTDGRYHPFSPAATDPYWRIHTQVRQYVSGELALARLDPALTNVPYMCGLKVQHVRCYIRRGT